MPPTLFGPTEIDSAELVVLSSDRLRVTLAGNSTVVVDVRGELLQETAARFADTVEPFADDHAVERLIVDLRGASFVDSAGLGRLVTLRNRTEARGGLFLLVRPGERVFRLFEITHLAHVFDYVDAP